MTILQDTGTNRSKAQTETHERFGSKAGSSTWIRAICKRAILFCDNSQSIVIQLNACVFNEHEQLTGLGRGLRRV